VFLGPLSVRLRIRAVLATAALALAVFLTLAADLSIGEVPLPFPDVVRALLGTGDATAELVITTLRLPRAVTGLLVGAALGVSGALLQGVTRNPLASPELVGITSGASAAAVAVIVLGDGGPSAVNAAAFAGAAGAAVLMYVLAYRRGVTGFRLVLVGIGVSTAATSVTGWLLVRADLVDLSKATIWINGSLNARSYADARPVAITLALATPVIAVAGRSLRALSLGDDTARGLGVRVGRARLVLLATSVALAGAAASAAGAVAFVALTAPHVARRALHTPDVPLGASALTGAWLMLAADVVSRRLFAPVEIPVGLVTGVIGAPFLLWTLARGSRR
jgi:iron complex transport system permease protein